EQFDQEHVTKSPYKLFLDQWQIELMDRFIGECRSMGIDVVLLYSPEYIEHQHVVINRGEIMELYRQLAAKYNIPFLDYSNDEICSRKELFYDSLHLNVNGTTVFSEKLASKLKEITAE